MDGEDFWVMEYIEDNLQEFLENTDDVVYLDIPSEEKQKQIWHKQLYDALPHLIKPKTK